MKRGGALLTAVDVARLCEVDLKTIHNWAAKGKILHHRTDGRHLRFRRLDVVDFLKHYGYRVPPSLVADRPRVAVLDADASSLVAVRRALAKRFDVLPFEDPIDLLVGLVAADPEALVLADAGAPAPAAIAARLAALPATRHVRVLVYAAPDRREGALAAGAAAFVARPETARLREALERLLAV